MSPNPLSTARLTASTIFTGGFSALASLFSGAAVAVTETGNRFDLTPGVTEISQQVLDMHHVMLYWCTGIGIVVFGAMLWSIINHRKSKGVKAAQFHENTLVEIVWTLVPFAILISMAIPATKLMKDQYNSDQSAITVEVTGSQWKWHYRYLDVEGDTSREVSFFSNIVQSDWDAIETPLLASGLFPTGTAKEKYGKDAPAKTAVYTLEVDNPVVIPSGKKVRFLITADDVIHSWFVPDFAIKKDAIPGIVNEAWTEVPEGKEGIYRGQCAELCGKNHAFMPIVVKVVSPAEFDQWLTTRWDAQLAAADALKNDINREFSFDELMQTGEKAYVAKCSACHQVSGAGVPPMFPALKGSAVATTGSVEDHTRLVINGKGAMPGFSNQLSPVELAAIVTYERNAWGNNTGESIQPKDVLSLK